MYKNGGGGGKGLEYIDKWYFYPIYVFIYLSHGNSP